MVADLVDDVAAGVSEAVREHDGVVVGAVAIEPVAQVRSLPSGKASAPSAP
jgi:hypothetical protein